MVLRREVDAAAIDSHVLDVTLLHDTNLAAELRVLATLGPTSIPPVVALKGLDIALKHRIQEAFLAMHHDPHAARALRAGLIEQFVCVTPECYEEIYRMYAAVREAGANRHT
jgi:phosphonate transport system substrate-binding protein